jgi:hypothetical protein
LAGLGPHFETDTCTMVCKILGAIAGNIHRYGQSHVTNKIDRPGLRSFLHVPVINDVQQPAILSPVPTVRVRQPHCLQLPILPLHPTVEPRRSQAPPENPQQTDKARTQPASQKGQTPEQISVDTAVHGG